MTALLALLKIAGDWAWGLLKLVPWQFWLFAAVVLAFLWYGESRADAREAEVRAEIALSAAIEADQVAQFLAQETERNRQREQALADQIHQASIDHAQALQDLEARSARTVADVRAGNLKLRQHWQACLGQLPQAGATSEAAAGDDAGADLRAADIGRVQRIAGACDAEVKWWQDTWNAAQRAVNGVQNER